MLPAAESTVGSSDESGRLVHFTVHSRNHEWDNWMGFWKLHSEWSHMSSCMVC